MQTVFDFNLTPIFGTIPSVYMKREVNYERRSDGFRAVGGFYPAARVQQVCAAL